MNVVKRIRGIDVEKLVQAGQISAEQVARLNAGLERPEAKAILREAMQSPSPGCAPMFANSKGRWRGSGWFTNKPDLQACESYCKSEDYDETNCPCRKLFERK